MKQSRSNDSSEAAVAAVVKLWHCQLKDKHILDIMRVGGVRGEKINKQFVNIK